MNGINLKFEKERTFSTTDLYNILNISTRIANVDGYMYSFIYERISVLLLAALVYPDLSEEIQDAISDSLFDAWDKYLENGIIEKVYKEHGSLFEEFSAILREWWYDYADHHNSFGAGIEGLFTGLSDDLVANTANKLNDEVTQSGVKEVIDIADKWGMNNKIPPAKEPNKPLPKEEESVFE